MLVLTRTENQTIVIGDVTITVLKTGPKRMRLGIEAPDDVRIWRGEMLEAKAEEEEPVTQQ